MPRETGPIDPRPAWLVWHQTEGTSVKRISVDQRDYVYTVVNYGVFPSHLPYFVGAEGVASIYISDNVHPYDREPILAHEIREKYRFPNLLEEDRCMAALAVEL